MLALELVVVLGVVVLAGEVLARRLRTAPPVLLLAAGALLALVPQLREVHLPPQAVLLLFLPALLWWESLNTSLRDIRRSLRGIVLVGLELPAAVRGLTSVDLARGVLAVVAVSVVLVVVRFAFLWLSARLIRLLDRRPSQRLRRVSDRSRVVSALAGFRGAVSLAAALAVPQAVDAGGPFPGRDRIVFVTAGVIAVTLAQSLLLPPVVRWARLPEDDAVEQERHMAETRATEDALAALPELGAGAGAGAGAEVVEQLAEEYRQHLQVLQLDGSLDHGAALRQHEQYTALRLAAVAHKRATVLQLRDQQQIDDTVLRQVQARLDLEELRLSRGQPVE